MWFNTNAAVVENYTFTERNVGSNIEWTITNNKTVQTDVLLFILEDDGNTSTYGLLKPPTAMPERFLAVLYRLLFQYLPHLWELALVEVLFLL